MALTHLVDTSVITRLAATPVRTVIAPLVQQGRLARAGITDLEIGFSSRNARAWDRCIADLDVFPLVETTAEHVRRARQVQRVLASGHQRGRKIPDLLTAAAAELTGWALSHDDRDFDLIAGATGQSCEWVVPQGSID